MTFAYICHIVHFLIDQAKMAYFTRVFSFRFVRLALLLILFQWPVQHHVKSQTIEEWMKTRRPLPIVQVYVHTDREFYFRKETVWLKAYLTFREDHELVKGVENLYVDLVDEKGDVVSVQNLIAANGEASGYLYLPDSLAPGNYLLRAYTSYLRDCGNDALYTKPLRVMEVLNSTELPAPKVKKRSAPLPDVAFLPEGGFLLANTGNQVAVKAVDTSGKGITLKGDICDENGTTVTTFDTKFQGMGSFYLTPSEDKTYFARLEDYPEFRKELAVQKKGIKLQVARQTEEEVVVHILMNTGEYDKQPFILADLYHGNLEFYKQFEAGSGSRTMRIPRNMFSEGINRLVLLDRNLKPVSERLFFNSHIDINKLTVTTDSLLYATRSAIGLQLADNTGRKEEEISMLSVAVVDENSVGTGGPSHSILSGLLLGPELKGYIENPAACFSSDTLSAEKKLDWLMMTHGWSNYLTDTLPAGTRLPDYQPEWGISLKGRAERILGKKPVPAGEIIVMLFNKDKPELMMGITDDEGFYKFDELLVIDSATVVVQVRNEKGKLNTEVFLDPIFKDPPEVTKSEKDILGNFTEIPVDLYRRKYFSDLALREFYPDTSSILLGEVEVKRAKREKEEDDGHFRIYGSTSHSIKIPDNVMSYSDILAFLAGRVAGLNVSGSSVSIRGGGTPNFLIDGMMYEGQDGVEMARSIPVSDVDVVDVLKDVSDLALFGSRGGNGIIAIYTKTGERTVSNFYTPGVIRRKLMGYQPFKEFYSPKYSPENVDRPEPDYRTTLYWNPFVNTKDGKANLSFFACDEVTHYNVYVEGITSEGRICTGTARFTVDRFR